MMKVECKDYRINSEKNLHPPRRCGSPRMTVEVLIVNWGQMSKNPRILIKDYKRKLTEISSSYSVHCLQVLLL